METLPYGRPDQAPPPRHILPKACSHQRHLFPPNRGVKIHLDMDIKEVCVCGHDSSAAPALRSTWELKAYSGPPVLFGQLWGLSAGFLR